MHSAFNYVIWIVCGLGIVVALFALMGSGKLWDEYGKRALLMDGDRAAPAAGSATALRERDDEIRQMLEARNARCLRRGERPLDVEAELRRITAPTIDAELREEIRDMVVARNHRRARRGEPPLDVDAEIEREIERLADL